MYLGQSSTASPDLGMGWVEYLGHCEILYDCWGPGASVFHKHILFKFSSLIKRQYNYNYVAVKSLLFKLIQFLTFVPLISTEVCDACDY